MRAALLLSAAALTLSPTGAAAQSAAPEPPRGQSGATAPAPVTATPQAPQSKPEAKEGFSANSGVGVANNTAALVANGGMAVGGSATPSWGTKRQMLMFNKGTAIVGNSGTLIDVAGKSYAIGTDIEQGKYGDATRKGAAAVIDACVDIAIDVGCKAGAVAYSGPGAIYTAPACVAAAQIVKSCAEGYAEKSLGQAVVEYGEKAAVAAVGLYDQLLDKMADTRADADNRMGAMSAANEEAIAAQAAADRAAAEQSYAGADTALIMNSLMQGLTYIPPPPPVPLAPLPPVPLAAPIPAPVAAPPPRLAVTPSPPSPPPRSVASVNPPSPPPQSRIGPPLPEYKPPVAGVKPCHAGHNEARHPGGCHKPPIGSTTN